MAKNKTKASAGTGKKKKTTTDALSLNQLCTLRDSERKAHFKAANTTKKYGEYVQRGRAFLASLVAEKRAAQVAHGGNNGGDHHDARGLQPEISTDELSMAFDDVPNRYSSMALELFLVEKCLSQGLRGSTAWGIYSGFKALWEMQGDSYRGSYSYDDMTKRVSGNPATSAVVKDIMKTIDNKNGVNGGSRNHAAAMTIEDMRKLMAWSYAQCPADSLDRLISQVKNNGRVDGAESRAVGEHLFIRAFTSSGFTIWTRNFELTKLRRKDITWNCKGPPYFIPHFVVNLLNRKGWQRKGEHDGALEGNLYEIYEQTETPEICMYLHLQAYFRYLEEVILRQPMEDDEFIFPRMGSNGVCYPTQETSYDTVQKALAKVSEDAGLSKHYSSHCLRRGGAQYRFMEAPLGERWSLSIVRWWGGWAESESVDTLIRYLLDELTKYEKGHSDALCPVPRQADLSFHGDRTLTQVITGAESRELKLSLDRKMDDVVDVVEKVSVKVNQVLRQLSVSSSTSGDPPSLPTTPLPTTSPLLQVTGSEPSLDVTLVPTFPGDVSSLVAPQPSPSPLSPPAFLLSAPASSFQAVSHAPTMPPPAVGEAARESEPTITVPPLAGVCIPNLSKGPDAWRMAVKQWEQPDKSIGNVALKDWPREWYTGGMKATMAAKRRFRQVIAEEFVSRHVSSHISILWPAFSHPNTGVKVQP
ncbi:hypothetical protein BJ138DRAFT_371218 [Hygrophoropsis aurantiaca]|uniref:Uncharacterized protein n=1 Tax=Hygrophoropsis aurantiaca TaxID=72124 RepID=A0ACB8A5I1_9AGAM|nr:hypothetical protein BJ138DRAFT_371218 [Hygrophoropsis aurantiaca]